MVSYGDAWGNTGGRVWDAITGRFPQDSPLDQSGDILGTVGKFTGGALVDAVAAGLNLPPYLVGADPWIKNPVGGMDWFDQNLLAEAPTADQGWRDLMAQDTAFDEATQSWVPFTPEEQVMVDQFTSGPGFGDETMAEVQARAEAVPEAAPVAAGPSVADLVAQLVAMKEGNVASAAARQREGLAAGEAARYERLRQNEADAFAQFEVFNQQRLDMEQVMKDKVATRGADTFQQYTDAGVNAQELLAGTGADYLGSLYPAAGGNTESALLASQDASQQNLLEYLTNAAAMDASGRRSGMASTYDQAGLDLSDALWAARSKIDEDELAQLQSIKEAALSAQVQGAQQAAAYAPMEQFFGAMGGAPIPGFVQSADQAGVLSTILGAMLRENDPETQMDTGGLAAQFPDLAQWGLGPGVVMTLDQIKQVIDIAGSSFIQAGS